VGELIQTTKDACTTTKDRVLKAFFNFISEKSERDYTSENTSLRM
jgi:hypothetical protein